MVARRAFFDLVHKRVLTLAVAVGAVMLIGCGSSRAAQAPDPEVTQANEYRAEQLGRVSPAEYALPIQASSALGLVCDSRVSAIYCLYKVPGSETAESIVAELGLQSSSLPAARRLVYSNMPDLIGESSAIGPGTRLRIPAAAGLIYVVRPGDTSESIAEAFGVDTAAVVSGIPSVAVTDPQVGQELLILDPTRLPEEHASADSSAALPSEFKPAWPARGPISSRYGPNHPKGVDIAISPGTAIQAIDGAEVAYAGGNACCGYGLYVILDHQNGFQSLYGHLSELQVKTGDHVEKRQTLGLSGSSGYSTGPHLHFELRHDDTLVDPLRYLPEVADLTFTNDADQPAVMPRAASTPTRPLVRSSVPEPTNTRTSTPQRTPTRIPVATPTQKRAAATPAVSSAPAVASTPTVRPAPSQPAAPKATPKAGGVATPLPPPGIVRR